MLDEKTIAAFSHWLRTAVDPPVGIGICFADGKEEFAPLAEDVMAMPATFSAHRQKTFLLGRAAVRSALSALGAKPVHVPRLESGAPQWPAGIRGSISHTDRLAVAVVSTRLDGIGIDVEYLDKDLDTDAFSAILTKEERHMKSMAAEADNMTRLTIFSAKEAAFKALSAFLPGQCGFWDISILPSGADDIFHAAVESVHDLPPCEVRSIRIFPHIFSLALVKFK